MFVIKAEICEPAATAFVFSKQKTMYGGKDVARGDVILSSPAKTRRPGPHRSWDRHLGRPDSKEARAGAANAARQHHYQAHRARETAPGAERAEGLF
jgi:hypothetical protein